MPGAVGDGPTVANSFANNFWGKDDAGVDPLLERMHNAKVTMDEVKGFYNTRAAIEEEYAKKMLALCRKPLGSSESGTLRASLDVVRGEVEAMGRAHQNIAGQMKSELEEPLSAFLGGMRERRKIVQSGIEKLLKVKVQQTQTANKTRDRFEQDCLRIKGYLAQGHMVMGQEERKNKAKLEKTQIQMATNSNDYELAIQALEETTGRWNREWKIACDKFQDLEEERLDFMKSSLWTFANIASTVCVTDDAACERIRLSLENCEVEKDITSFIAEKGSGQEIPDPPKYINFCRGDMNDSASEISVEDAYSVAQFKRTTNPMYRTSSPQPPKNDRDHRAYLGDEDDEPAHRSREATVTPQKAASVVRAQVKRESADIGEVPHNDFPEDGMTMFCRNDPAPSAPSSSLGHNKIWDDSHSEYSGPTSVSSYDMESGKTSPTKQIPGNESGVLAASTDSKTITKKRSGFFSNSPFRRKSKHEKERPQSMAAPATRNLWGKSAGASQSIDTKDFAMDDNEPVDPRASFQVNIGQNVFDVASPLQSRSKKDTSANDDPLAVALAELKVGGKQSASRVSADRYHGLATPAPGQQLAQNNSAVASAQRGTPPPGYESPANRLGAPQPAHTRAQMQATTQHYTNQNANAYGSPTRQHGGSNSRGGPPPRAASPSPMRATSPRPGYQGQQQQQQRYPEGPDSYRRSASPNPHAQMMSGGPYPPHNNFGGQGHPNPMQRAASPRPQLDDRNRPSSMNRAASPRPQYSGQGGSSRPGSRDANMALQLSSNEMQGRQQHHGHQNGGRPSSYYDGPQNNNNMRGRGGQGGPDGRMRSKSQVDGRQFNRDGQAILHFARALYSYSAAIPEELSFQKGDVLAVLRLQDDGWWEAEVKGRNGRPGLVPSNYLQNC